MNPFNTFGPAVFTYLKQMCVQIKENITGKTASGFCFFGKTQGQKSQFMNLALFISLYLKAFIQNLVQNGPVVFEKIQFEFLYVHDLGPRSSNDLDLQYSHTFMKSISCLYLPTFRSQASIVSEKIHCFHFFLYRKA